MVGLHVGAVLLDPALHFGALSALVPFAAPWKPGAIAAGVVAGWLSLALAASFRMRKWIGQKGWRRLHYATFARVRARARARAARRHRPEGPRRPGARAARGGAGALAHLLPAARAADGCARGGRSLATSAPRYTL